MEVKYDIPQYIASVKMSKKNRILVEGKDDKSHLRNLIFSIFGESKVKVDTAEIIKGICCATAKNNRAKLDEIHRRCCSDAAYSNLYFLCDREFSRFVIEDKITDLMLSHENSGNLYWTIGHSFENYFIDADIISDAFRYLTGSEFKERAVSLFKSIFPQVLVVVATISLAAKEIGKASYPIGVISWRDFLIKDGLLHFPTDGWREDDSSEIKYMFVDCYKRYIEVVKSSDNSASSRVSRGHTAVRMTQRIFSYCLYKSGEEYNKELAGKHANEFSKLKEASLSSALCEAWLRSIAQGNRNYPASLISSVT